MKINHGSQQYAVEAIRLMRIRKDPVRRLYNFILINYRVSYSIRQCQRIWAKYHKKRIRSQEVPF